MLFMASKVIDISTYEPKSSDIFFFDNNVWMYLFCPLGDYNKSKQKLYTAFLKNIKISGSTVFINSLVISEFANSYLRLDFKRWIEEIGFTNAKYKNDFVGTDRYKETVNEITNQINQILRISSKCTDNFNAIDIDRVFELMPEIDFNDSYYIELAKMQNWKIVTDDRDFKKFPELDLVIITSCN